MRLGRRFDPDPRDHNYPIRALLAAEPTRTHRYWWPHGLWVDQVGGTCVGASWAHFIEDGPRTWEGQIDYLDIYRQACLLDVWADNDDGNLDAGTSVRAGAQALQNSGRITVYRWAFDAQTIVEALLTLGPVVVGTSWWTSMFSPTNGVLRIGGQIEGGHAYVLDGVNISEPMKRRFPGGMVRIKNSWNRSWGTRGFAWLSVEDLDRLISEDGEAVIATETTP